MGHNGCDGSQASGPWAIGSGYRFNTFLDRCSQFGRCISAGKGGMRGGGPGNSLPGLLLGGGHRIPYLMERIPELIFPPQPEHPVADLILN